MTYYFSKTLPVSFDEAVRRITEALKKEGFGIIMEIDVKQTLKAKIGVDFRNYRILGACNPKLAYEALQLENKIGTMLPCNVVVQESGPSQTEIAAMILLHPCRQSITHGSCRRRSVFKCCCGRSSRHCKSAVR